MISAGDLAWAAGAIACASGVAGLALWQAEKRIPERVPEDKRWYVAKNLTQGAVLTVLAPVGVSIVANGVLRDDWPAAPIAVCAAAYAATNVAALFVVPGLMRSTVVHHLVVGATSTAIVASGGAVAASAAGRAAVVYASFSAVAGCVNVYLGARFLVPRGSRVVRWGAAVYGSTLLVNLPAQVWLTLVPTREPRWPTLAWLAATLTLVYDDGILLGHLVRAATTATAADKAPSGRTGADD